MYFNIRTAETYMMQEPLQFYQNISHVRGYEGTTKGTQAEHGRQSIHYSGNTIRLGTGRLEMQDNKCWKILEMKLYYNGILGVWETSRVLRDITVFPPQGPPPEVLGHYKDPIGICGKFAEFENSVPQI